MKIPRILVLLISMLLFGCAKDDFVPTAPRIVKEIDSIAFFSISDDNDTSYHIITKFIYGKNYSSIRVIDFSWSDINDQSYPIIRNKITIQHIYNYGSWRQEYFFNNNHFLIKERFVDNNTNQTTDSTTYKYDAFDRLLSKTFFGNTSSGETRRNETHMYRYFWQGYNLVKITHNSIGSNKITIQFDDELFFYGNEINPLSFLYLNYNSPIEYNPLYKTGIASKNLCTSSKKYFETINYSYKFSQDSSMLEIRSIRNSSDINFIKLFYK